MAESCGEVVKAVKPFLDGLREMRRERDMLTEVLG